MCKLELSESQYKRYPTLNFEANGLNLMKFGMRTPSTRRSVLIRFVKVEFVVVSKRLSFSILIKYQCFKWRCMDKVCDYFKWAKTLWLCRNVNVLRDNELIKLTILLNKWTLPAEWKKKTTTTKKQVPVVLFL